MKFKLTDLVIKEAFGTKNEGELNGQITFTSKGKSLCDDAFVIRLEHDDCLEIADLIADKIEKSANTFIKQVKTALKQQKEE